MDSEKPPESRQDGRDSEEKVYPSWKKVLPAMIAIYLVFFLVALDRTIIGTAIPTISADFNSFGDIAWYEAAFLLPLAALQLSFGLVLKFYRTKWILSTLTAVFIVGSIVCAAAPNSNALIVGRAITGMGGAGISSGCYLFITLLVPLEARPKYLGALGSTFGITSFLGPILGGYLTSVTWRWCFWINLPIAGLALFLLLIFAPDTASSVKRSPTWKGKILELDPLGFVLIAPSIICLLFALQLGGMGSWSEGRIIALFVVFAVLLIAFVGYQIWQKEKATIPPRIITQRTVFVACFVSFGIGSVLVMYSFYLPIWFQVVQGKSPQSSGLSLLPFLLSIVILVVGGGILVSQVGYFTPFSIIGAAILVVGAALITRWTADISKGRWIGYQIITGIGLGLCLQQPAIAVQTVLPDSDIPIGQSILSFVLSIGGSVFVTVSQTLLEQQLNDKLIPIIPDLDPARLAGSGAASLRDIVSPDKLDMALAAYNDSMRAIWYLALALSCVTFVASFGLEWKSVKAKNKNHADSNENEAVEAAKS